MRREKQIVILITLLFFSLCNAQNKHRFDSITIEDGLSQSMVNCLWQDSDGFIWIGTKDGLNRFDGYAFTVFRHDPDEPSSLRSNYINDIYEDFSQNLWICTRKGLSRFNKANNTFVTFYPDSPVGNPAYSDRVNCVFEDSHGRIWLGLPEGGIAIFDRTNEKFTKYYQVEKDVKSNYVVSIVETSRGEILAATYRSGVKIYDETNDSFSTYMPQGFKDLGIDFANFHVTGIEEDFNGNYWISSSLSGIYIVDPKTEQATYFNSSIREEISYELKHINGLLFDSKGRMWMSSQFGLASYNLQTDELDFYQTDPTDDFSISLDHTTDILEDRSGIIWVGTSGFGINTLSPSKYKFSVLRKTSNDANSLSNDYIYAIYEDRFGDLWLGGTVGDLTRANLDKMEFKNYKYFDTEGRRVSPGFYSITELSSGDLLCVARNGEISVYDYETDRLQSVYHHIDAVVTYTLRDGRVCVGSNYFGLFVFSGDFLGEYDSVLYDDKLLPSNTVTSVYQCKCGTIWVGTDAGLIEFDTSFNKKNLYNESGPEGQSLLVNDVLCINEIPGNKLLVGTPMGLNIIDLESRSISYFTSDDGLPNNVIYGILVDNDNKVWVSTNKGLARIDIETEEVISFDEDDGLQSNEFNRKAFFKNSDGRLYFGGVYGLNYFYPDQIRFNTTKPPVVLTSLKVLNKEYISETPINELAEIDLSYEERFVSLEFAALDFNNSAKNRYRYKMENIDKDWVEAGDRRFVNYNLEPGLHTFHVIASNNDGVWNEVGKKLKIKVRPPWWDSLLFRVSAVIFIIILVILTILIRTRNLKKQRDLLQKEVIKRTKDLEIRKIELEEINKELEAFNYTVSHDLRSPLITIAGFAEIIEHEIKSSELEDLKVHLNKIKSATNRMDQLIKDILSFSRSTRKEVTPENINLSLLAHEVFEEIKMLNRGRVGDFILEKDLFGYGDPALLRIVLANLLENAMKYSRNKERFLIEFGAKTSGKNTAYFISDNGIGIDMDYSENLFLPFKRLHAATEYEGSGIGLATAHRIIRKHNGQIWVESLMGQGSTFYFTLKLKKPSEE